jgi:hypothetical protein
MTSLPTGPTDDGSAGQDVGSPHRYRLEVSHPQSLMPTAWGRPTLTLSRWFPSSWSYVTSPPIKGGGIQGSGVISSP